MSRSICEALFRNLKCAAAYKVKEKEQPKG